MRTQHNPDGTPFSFDNALNFIKEKRIVVNPTFRLTKDLASSIHPASKMYPRKAKKADDVSNNDITTEDKNTNSDDPLIVKCNEL